VSTLRKGDAIHLHESRSGIWRGVVSRDQIEGDRVVWFALEGDDPASPYYGKRTAWRSEVSRVHQAQVLKTPLGELVGRP
jgi:hypothetical protein